MFRLTSLALLFGIFASASLYAAPRVEMVGSVANPGWTEIAEGVRLGELLQSIQVDPQGYWLAAAWLRPRLVPEQQRLKAGVLVDTTLLKNVALLQNKPGLSSLAKRLAEQIKPLPVTGREIHPMDPLALELDAAHSPHLENGDRLIYPPRPDRVRVSGAVGEDCFLPFVVLQPAYRYAEQCAALKEADRDYLFVIQPDGHVTRIGIAQWNRDDGAAPPAPGATLLVPLDLSGYSDLVPDLNHELAQFLATQPLILEQP